MEVQLFIPCFMDQLFPETAFNVVKVLEKAGCSVRYVESQTCCGQPAYNAGFRKDAKAVCTKFLKDFNGTVPIIPPSASCAGFIRNYYASLFDKSPDTADPELVTSRVYEFTDFLVNRLGVTQLDACFEAKATYHDSCAALREYTLQDEARTLLREVKGLELVEMADNTTCCGFGGTFAVKFEPISVAMGDQKSRHAADTGAEVLISTDMSCLMHISGVLQNQGAGIRCLHIADILASGY